MNITLTDTLLLGAILALLMINFASRRIAAAQASRMLVKDHLKNTRHPKHGTTMLVLRSRLSLLTAMLAFSALGVLFAFIAAAFVVLEWNEIAKITLIVGLVAGIISLLQSVRESSIANNSHFGEVDATISKDDPYYGAGAP